MSDESVYPSPLPASVPVSAFLRQPLSVSPSRGAGIYSRTTTSLPATLSQRGSSFAWHPHSMSLASFPLAHFDRSRRAAPQLCRPRRERSSGFVPSAASLQSLRRACGLGCPGGARRTRHRARRLVSRLPARRVFHAESSLARLSARSTGSAPNHALQRTGHGGEASSVFFALRRHGLSLSLDSLGPESLAPTAHRPLLSAAGTMPRFSFGRAECPPCDANFVLGRADGAHSGRPRLRTGRMSTFWLCVLGQARIAKTWTFWASVLGLRKRGHSGRPEPSGCPDCPPTLVVRRLQRLHRSSSGPEAAL